MTFQPSINQRILPRRRPAHIRFNRVIVVLYFDKAAKEVKGKDKIQEEDNRRKSKCATFCFA